MFTNSISRCQLYLIIVDSHFQNLFKYSLSLLYNTCVSVHCKNGFLFKQDILCNLKCRMHRNKDLKPEINTKQTKAFTPVVELPHCVYVCLPLKQKQVPSINFIPSSFSSFSLLAFSKEKLKSNDDEASLYFCLPNVSGKYLHS